VVQRSIAVRKDNAILSMVNTHWQKLQLIPQLLGRPMANQAVVATGFLDAARQSLLFPAILEQHASLTPPGAETARLEEHSGLVIAVCVLPDGRLASGSYDGTIRIVELLSGAEIKNFATEGQPGLLPRCASL
jgi:WD40 repeat protein